MHLFTSCFLGIPLPIKFVGEFHQLQQRVMQVLPTIDLANPMVPHITLYYLGSQIVENFEEIMHRAKRHSGLLHGEELRCSGFDYFRHHDPKVLFVQVEHSPNIEQFYRVMREELSSFRIEQETRDFHAHLTVGRMRDEVAQREFVEKEDRVLKIGDSITWNFDVEQIALYGVDNELPQDGQRIITAESI